MTDAPLNIDCFANAEAKFDPHYAFDRNKVEKALAEASGQRSRNAGMFNPTRIHLKLGQDYFRFCDSARPNPRGGWWVDAETFFRLQRFARTHQHIIDFATATGVSALTYAAKLHLAVPFEWGDSNVIVQARLLRRMDAYAGKGNVAYLDSQLAEQEARGIIPAQNRTTPPTRNSHDGGAKYIPLRDDVMQLFVPDMALHFDRCMRLVRQDRADLFLS